MYGSHLIPSKQRTYNSYGSGLWKQWHFSLPAGVSFYLASFEGCGDDDDVLVGSKSLMESKKGCFNACAAVIRLDGSYCSIDFSARVSGLKSDQKTGVWIVS